MECSGSNFACQLMVLLADHGIDLAEILNWAPQIAITVRENIQAIIGLLGFGFGLWRWYRYREQVLHERLRSYLNDEDERLRHARHDVLASLRRPGQRRDFAAPLFTVKPLRRILKRRKWDSVFRIGRIERNVEQQLNKALTGIAGRLQTAERQLASLHSQQASAHLLKGAIVAAGASRIHSVKRQVELNNKALTEFRTVRQIPGYENHVEAKEFEAQQLCRLGHLEQAKEAYVAFESLVVTNLSGRDRNFAVARSKRWRASIEQWYALEEFEQRQKPGPGSGVARDLMASTGSASSDPIAMSTKGALALRAQYAPHNNWDAIEQGDFHYLAAFIYRNLAAHVQETIQLANGETEYRRILEQMPRFENFASTGTKRLGAAARAGLKRILEAREGHYDRDWLLPPSNVPKNPSSSIS